MSTEFFIVFFDQTRSAFAVRTGTNNELRHYEHTTLGTA